MEPFVDCEHRDDSPRNTAPEAAASLVESPLRALLHRWFVEYNPLYLVSALLVLAGLTLISLNKGESTYDVQIGGSAAIAEVYALSLLGGAALLMRIGMRRPAVVLAVLAAIYQCDLTMLTERSAYLGLVGQAAAAGWVVLFVAKLWGLGWAMRLRLSRSALAVPALAAVGLAAAPHLLAYVGRGLQSAVASLGLTAIVATALWTKREITSQEDLDGWGTTVLRRASKTAWLACGALLYLHVAFWRYEHDMSWAILLPALLVIVVRYARSEARVWWAVAGSLAFAGWVWPSLGRFEGRSWFAFAALISAAVLALRAIRLPVFGVVTQASHSTIPPYRAWQSEGPVAQPELRFVVAPRGQLERLLTGSLFCAYVGLMALFNLDSLAGWAHHATLDIPLTAVALLLLFRLRAHVVALPLSLTYVHWAFESHWLRAPETWFGWGVTAVGVGFAILAGSLGVSYLLRAGPAGLRQGEGARVAEGPEPT